MTSAESSGNVTHGSSSLEVSAHMKPSSGHRGKMTAWWTCIFQIRLNKVTGSSEKWRDYLNCPFRFLPQKDHVRHDSLLSPPAVLLPHVTEMWEFVRPRTYRGTVLNYHFPSKETLWNITWEDWIHFYQFTRLMTLWESNLKTGVTITQYEGNEITFIFGFFGWNLARSSHFLGRI